MSKADLPAKGQTKPPIVASSKSSGKHSPSHGKKVVVHGHRIKVTKRLRFADTAGGQFHVVVERTRFSCVGGPVSDALVERILKRTGNGHQLVAPSTEAPAPTEAPPAPRRRSTLELASDLLANAGLWLRTPNPNLGDRPPIDLIDTEEEDKVYYLLKALDLGLF